MLENLIKGWVLSLIGLVGLLGVIAHSTGFYKFPNPAFLDDTYECIIAGVVCFALLLLPKSKIEVAIEKLWLFVVNKFTGSK